MGSGRTGGAWYAEARSRTAARLTELLGEEPSWKEHNEVSENNRTMTAEVCDVGQAWHTTLPPSSCYCCH